MWWWTASLAGDAAAAFQIGTVARYHFSDFWNGKRSKTVPNCSKYSKFPRPAGGRKAASLAAFSNAPEPLLRRVHGALMEEKRARGT